MLSLRKCTLNSMLKDSTLLSVPCRSLYVTYTPGIEFEHCHTLWITEFFKKGNEFSEVD